MAATGPDAAAEEDRRCSLPERTPRTWEVLTESECRTLLAGAAVGRLGFTTGALPAITPVPFAVRHGRVVIPALPGSREASACRRAVVAFEVDSVDRGDGSAWAVTVVGHARVVTGSDEIAALDDLGLRLWAGRSGCYIVVETSQVTGWRVLSQGRRTDEVDRVRAGA
ncbi:pyridoxamine 5'-phosphate oxidase family protein [Geodermatophilus saharensis]|uniref:pyridoxamine 5'-phosphate oxidase family protein n=1 Tax=Geodermatophilus saharensis TaxID=1137994 RepID=UPI001595D1B0|nr:pyridoxamine 5'-phosphate oxidase family protein [Geodermatophilus saharensis]